MSGPALLTARLILINRDWRGVDKGDSLSDVSVWPFSGDAFSGLFTTFKGV